MGAVIILLIALIALLVLIAISIDEMEKLRAENATLKAEARWYHDQYKRSLDQIARMYVEEVP